MPHVGSGEYYAFDSSIDFGAIYTPYLKNPDMPIISHNSFKNRTLSIIFDTINCPLMLDILPNIDEYQLKPLP